MVLLQVFPGDDVTASQFCCLVHPLRGKADRLETRQNLADLEDLLISESRFAVPGHDLIHDELPSAYGVDHGLTGRRDHLIGAAVGHQDLPADPELPKAMIQVLDPNSFGNIPSDLVGRPERILLREIDILARAAQLKRQYPDHAKRGTGIPAALPDKVHPQLFELLPHVDRRRQRFPVRRSRFLGRAGRFSFVQEGREPGPGVSATRVQSAEGCRTSGKRKSCQEQGSGFPEHGWPVRKQRTCQRAVQKISRASEKQGAGSRPGVTDPWLESWVLVRRCGFLQHSPGTMPHDYRRVAAVLAAAVLLVIAGAYLAEGGTWTTYQCRLLGDRYHDGDSFWVKADTGWDYIFRLYGVDCPETDNRVKSRVKEQAEHFGVSESTVLIWGRKATRFTERFLAREFTVHTKKEKAKSASSKNRYYAVVEGEEGRLDEALVRAGLARAYGQTVLWPVDKLESRWEFLDRLKELEKRARREKRGIWAISRR